MSTYHAERASAQPLLARLEGLQKSGNGWRARCPACGGQSRKLSIAERDDKVLVHCFACNDADGVLEAVGLRWPDLHPPRSWPLTTAARRAQHRVIREVGIASAVDVLAVESVVLCLAAQQLADWPILDVPDNDRLALACDRTGKAAVVLTGKDSFRPDYTYTPARLLALKRGVVNELRRQLDVAERELAALAGKGVA